jgi:hypothetical protein
MDLDRYLEWKVLIKPEAVSPVRRSKKDARNFYNNISRYYDWLGGLFERKLTNKALDYLNIQKGERVLEIGASTSDSFYMVCSSVSFFVLAFHPLFESFFICYYLSGTVHTHNLHKVTPVPTDMENSNYTQSNACLNMPEEHVER